MFTYWDMLEKMEEWQEKCKKINTMSGATLGGVVSFLLLGFFGYTEIKYHTYSSILFGENNFLSKALVLAFVALIVFALLYWFIVCVRQMFMNINPNSDLVHKLKCAEIIILGMSYFLMGTLFICTALLAMLYNDGDFPLIASMVFMIAGAMLFPFGILQIRKKIIKYKDEQEENT